MTATLSSDIPSSLEKTITRVLQAACTGELTLATAESCTGGLIVLLLTDVSGNSHAFERGIVVYTESAKTRMLRVPSEML